MGRESEQKFASQMMGLTIFIVTTGLLFMPSKITPTVSWLDAIHFDKIVHFILFGSLTISWCIYYYKGNFRSATKQIMYKHMFIIFSLYAIAVEYAQGYYVILGRSFDYLDMAAGITGNLVAYMYAREQFVRKD